MSNLLPLIIADDEAFMRENLSRLFPWEELGYTVCAVCADGFEAYQALLKYQADVILTDIQMPVWNGIELAKAIREQHLDTDIVFLSAYSDFEYARQGIFYGVFDYLVKPVCYQELSELFTRIRTDILSSRQIPEPLISGAELTLKKISVYIRKAPALSTLETCADAIGLPSAYLSELMRKQSGMTFAEFVYQEKMLLAGELLRNIGLQVNTVADMVGYANAKNFSRAFHNYYHMTPMQYRKQGGDST